MWKSAYVGVYQLLNWKMHGETLKFNIISLPIKWYSELLH